MPQSLTLNRRLMLAARPKGEPTVETLRMETAALPHPAPGQMLLRTEYLSLDPYMRGRMSDAPSYAPPVALESDSKLYERYHCLASMRVTRRMWAMSSHASALAMVFSQSFAIRRQRPSHAKVRSTTHLRGMTSKPIAVSERLTI